MFFLFFCGTFLSLLFNESNISLVQERISELQRGVDPNGFDVSDKIYVEDIKASTRVKELEDKQREDELIRDALRNKISHSLKENPRVFAMPVKSKDEDAGLPNIVVKRKRRVVDDSGEGKGQDKKERQLVEGRQYCENGDFRENERKKGDGSTDDETNVSPENTTIAVDISNAGTTIVGGKRDNGKAGGALSSLNMYSDSDSD